MLGITIADAIAIGMFILACGAAWKGATKGDAERKTNPPKETLSIGSGVFADTAAMTNMTNAMNRLSAAIENAVEDRTEKEKDRMTAALEALVEKLNDRDGGGGGSVTPIGGGRRR